MAISAYSGAQIDTANSSFQAWVDRTNQIQADMATLVVSIGRNNVGNTYIDGILEANSVVVQTALRGGNTSASANLSISSNTSFSGANVSLSTATNMNTLGNVTFGGATKAFTVNNNQTIINSTSMTVASPTVEFTGDMTANNIAITGTLSGTITATSISSTSYGGTDLSISGYGRFGAGSEAAPSISFAGDTNSGFYSSAADQVSLALGGLNAVDFGSDITVHRDVVFTGNTTVLGTLNADTLLVTTGAVLAVESGGTGANTAPQARTNLGLEIGTNVQAWNAKLDQIAAFTPQSNFIIVGDGVNWTLEPYLGGSNTTIDDTAWDPLGVPLSIANGGTGAQTAAAARTNLGLGSLAQLSTINNGNWSGTDLAVVNGGTGASDVVTARSNLGLGTLATLSTINDSHWSGTDLSIANGGTGSSTAAGARTNLGLGTLATLSTVNDSNWSGTDLSIANGGTGASTAAGARANLGVIGTGDNVSFGTITGSGDMNIDAGVLFVDVSTNRVGINDTSPSYSLDVSGTLRVTSTANFDAAVNVADEIIFGSFGSQIDPSIHWGDVDTGIYGGTSEIKFTTNGTYRGGFTASSFEVLSVDTRLGGDNELYVDVSANRVGIRTATPSYTLDVTGTLRTTSTATFDGAISVGGLATVSDLAVTTGRAEFQDADFQGRVRSYADVSANTAYNFGGASDWNTKFERVGAGNVQVTMNGTVAMDIAGGATNFYGISTVTASGAAGARISDDGLIRSQRDGSGASTATSFQTYYGTNITFETYADGDVYANNVSYALLTNRSSIEYKKNVVDTESQIDNILKLRIVDYEWKDGINVGGSTGLILEETVQVWPDVSVIKTREDGTIASKSIDFTRVYNRALKALQETIAEVKDLKARNRILQDTIDDKQSTIDALESRIAAIEERLSAL